MTDTEHEEPPKPLNYKEVAQRLGVSSRTAWQWMNDGEIPSFRVGPTGRTLRAKPEDVERYIASRRFES